MIFPRAFLRVLVYQIFVDHKTHPELQAQQLIFVSQGEVGLGNEIIVRCRYAVSIPDRMYLELRISYWNTLPLRRPARSTKLLAFRRLERGGHLKGRHLRAVCRCEFAHKKAIRGAR